MLNPALPNYERGKAGFPSWCQRVCSCTQGSLKGESGWKIPEDRCHALEVFLDRASWKLQKGDSAFEAINQSNVTLKVISEHSPGILAHSVAPLSLKMEFFVFGVDEKV